MKFLNINAKLFNVLSFFSIFYNSKSHKANVTFMKYLLQSSFISRSSKSTAGQNIDGTRRRKEVAYRAPELLFMYIFDDSVMRFVVAIPRICSPKFSTFPAHSGASLTVLVS